MQKRQFSGGFHDMSAVCAARTNFVRTARVPPEKFPHLIGLVPKAQDNEKTESEELFIERNTDLSLPSLPLPPSKKREERSIKKFGEDLSRAKSCCLGRPIPTTSQPTARRASCH